MYGIIFLFLAMFCQNPDHHCKKNNNDNVQTTLDETVDDPGDTGHVPPKPPVPPPPGQ